MTHSLVIASVAGILPGKLLATQSKKPVVLVTERTLLVEQYTLYVQSSNERLYELEVEG